MECNWPPCRQPAIKNGFCFHHNRVYGSSEVKKGPKPIADKSSKRKELEKEYLKLKKVMMAESNKCEAGLEGCDKIAVDLHHLSKRSEKNLCDRNNLIRVCRICHNWIENNPLEALTMGLSKSKYKIS